MIKMVTPHVNGILQKTQRCMPSGVIVPVTPPPAAAPLNLEETKKRHYITKINYATFLGSAKIST